MNNLDEAKREFQDLTDQAFARKLKKLLLDDGRGHHHAAYAARLDDFIVKLVPYDLDPDLTACINWETGCIEINDGFLNLPANDPNTTKDDKFHSVFRQLSVLIRHEMAHDLMRHQTRMQKKITDKYGKVGESRISMSMSLHTLMNVIEDFEISNTRYTKEDKQTVLNMWLNGELIGGLVTSTHHRAWKDLKVEDMWDALVSEIDKLNTELTAFLESGDYAGAATRFKDDQVHNRTIKAASYKDINADTNIMPDIYSFMNGNGLYHFLINDGSNSISILKFSSFPDTWQKLMKSIYNEFIDDSGDADYSKQHVKDLIKDIADTAITSKYTLKSPITGKIVCELYSPEEKLIAVDILKAIIPTLEAYDEWYKKVQEILNDPENANVDKKALLAELENLN